MGGSPPIWCDTHKQKGTQNKRVANVIATLTEVVCLPFVRDGHDVVRDGYWSEVLLRIVKVNQKGTSENEESER